jgi:hypothetical protein
LQKDQYTNFVFASFIVTIIMAVFCVLIQMVLLYLPVRRISQLAPKAMDDSAGAGESGPCNRDSNANLTSKLTHRRGWFTGEQELSSSKYLQTDDARSVAYDDGDRGRKDDGEAPVCCNEEDILSTLSTLLAFALAMIFIFVVVLWTIVVSTQHRVAVEDLMMQLTNSTDTALGTSLVDAQKMVKQATSV